MTGCTFGKGNLFHLDYGKNAFTFVRRSDGKSIRIVTRPDAWGKRDAAQQELQAKVHNHQATEAEEEDYQRQQLARAYAILERPFSDLFIITPVQPNVPAKARIHHSIICAGCGEAVMETRSRLFRGEQLCIPCFEARDRRFG